MNEHVRIEIKKYSYDEDGDKFYISVDVSMASLTLEEKNIINKIFSKTNIDN